MVNKKSRVISDPAQFFITSVVKYIVLGQKIQPLPHMFLKLLRYDLFK